MNEDFFNFLISKEWIDFNKYCDSLSFMKQIEFFSKEDANSNFLVSILDPYKNGDLGIYPLVCFLQLLKTNKAQELKNVNLLTAKIDIQEPIKLRQAHKINELILHPDIVIDFNLNEQAYEIILEAKLQAAQDEKQGEKYQKIANASDSNTKMILVYLDQKAIAKEIIKSYTPISYQNLIDYIYTPCLLKTENLDIKNLISQYEKSFIDLYLSNKGNLMVSYQLKTLVHELWLKHKDIILNLCGEEKNILNIDESSFGNLNNNLKIVYTIVNNYEELNDLDRKTISKGLKFCGKKYYFDGELCTTKINFRYKVLERLIQEYKITQINDLPDKIRYCEGKNFSIIIDKATYDKLPDNVKKYYELSNGAKGRPGLKLYNGKELIYYSNTGVESYVDKFVAAIKEIYLDYYNKYIKVED